MLKKLSVSASQWLKTENDFSGVGAIAWFVFWANLVMPLNFVFLYYKLTDSVNTVVSFCLFHLVLDLLNFSVYLFWRNWERYIQATLFLNVAGILAITFLLGGVSHSMGLMMFISANVVLAYILLKNIRWPVIIFGAATVVLIILVLIDGQLTSEYTFSKSFLALHEALTVFCNTSLILIIVYLIFSELRGANLSLKEKTNSLQKFNNTQSKLITIISHDLRGAMTSIYLMPQLAIKMLKKQQFAELEKNLFQCNEATRSLGVFLDNVLYWVSQQTDQITIKEVHFSLNKLVNEIFTIYKFTAETKNIKLNNLIPDNLELYFDRNILHLVLRNLIGNALKFTASEGEVTVKFYIEANRGVLLVRDSGIGMSAEQVMAIHVNNWYNNRGGKKIGTGFGLMLVKEFAEQLGAGFLIKSEVGKGTDVHFLVEESAVSFEHTNLPPISMAIQSDR